MKANSFEQSLQIKFLSGIVSPFFVFGTSDILIRGSPRTKGKAHGMKWIPESVVIFFTALIIAYQMKSQISCCYNSLFNEFIKRSTRIIQII